MSIRRRKSLKSRDGVLLVAAFMLALIGPGPANPGYLACLVAALGLIVAWRTGGAGRQVALFWALAALVFWVMTLGPFLIVVMRAHRLGLALIAHRGCNRRDSDLAITAVKRLTGPDAIRVTL